MRTLLIGTSGKTGQQVLKNTLKDNDQVIVLTRHPDLFKDDPKIKVVKGDVTNEKDVMRALSLQPDVIISTLGTNRSFVAHGLFSTAMANIIKASKKFNVKRLVWMSSFGVGQTYKRASLLQKLGFSTFLRNVYKDKLEAEKLLTKSDLIWTIVYPMKLTNEADANDYRTGVNLKVKGMNPKVSRAEVGDFMAKVAHDNQFKNDKVIISGK